MNSLFQVALHLPPRQVDTSASKRFSIRIREDGASPVIKVVETLTVLENEGGAAGETHIVHFANPQDGLAAPGSRGADFLVEETTFDAEALSPGTFRQNPTPCTLNPTPCTLNPTP